MKKKVSLARALKEKNRVAGWLKQALGEVQKENSKYKNLPRAVDVSEMYERANALRKRLIGIKTAIAVANQGIVEKIIELAELKSQIVFLNNLDVREEVFQDYDSEDDGVDYPVDFDYRRTERLGPRRVVISKAQVLKEVDVLQRRAHQLQDDLDEFNAITKVEIEMDDGE